MNNKTKKGMMDRFLEGALPSAPSPTPLKSAKSSKPLSGMDVLNKAMEVLGSDAASTLVDISAIGIDPKNKRALSPAEFLRLKNSIESDGLFNPITVRKSDQTQYQFIAVAGHNRLQALKDLGYQSVPVNVVDLKDDGTKAAFISNLLQPELGIAEIFDGLKILRAAEGEHKSVRQLASETGFSIAYISQVMSMEQLPASLVVAMKKARVRVGSNALKGFVKVFVESKGAKLAKLTESALAMIESNSAEVLALSPTLSDSENLALSAGEDAASKSWQKALSLFVAEHSDQAGKAPKNARKVNLKGWSVAGVERRKASVVLNFKDETEAQAFFACVEHLKDL